jgi:hypothetical protein
MQKADARVGMKVVFGRPGDYAEKSLGKIIKVNPSKAKVELLEERGRGKGHDVGSIWLVPYALMEKAPEDGSKNVVIKSPQSTSGQAVGIGTTFRSVHADSNALWKVRKVQGKDCWLCEIQNEPIEINGVLHDSDYVGTQRVFLTSQIKASKSSENFFANLGKQHDQFYESLTVGQQVHYMNFRDAFVRCIVIKEEGKNVLKPIALVGNWNDSNLPYRYPNGEIYYPTYAKSVIDGKTMTPNASNIWENGKNGNDPINLPAIDLTVPEMTEQQIIIAKMLKSIKAIQGHCETACKSLSQDDVSNSHDLWKQMQDKITQEFKELAKN